MAGALTGLLSFISDDRQLRDLTFWGLGSLAGASWTKLAAAGPLIAAALIGGIGTLVGGNTKWRSREGVLIGAGTGTIGALGGYLLWTLRRRRPRP